MPMDLAISEICYLRAKNNAKPVKVLLDNCEPFGHAVGATLIVIAVYVLDVRRRPCVPHIWALSVGAGLLASSMKLLVGRLRPREVNFSSATVSSTFDSWLPLLPHHSATGSFPSAHTALAAALAFLLSRLYPRGRVLFAVLAILVGAHRLHSGAHFASDVLFGGAIGWLFALVIDARSGMLPSPAVAAADLSPVRDCQAEASPVAVSVNRHEMCNAP
jgi:membrane-associated PAP2 superfamily phosphatase